MNLAKMSITEIQDHLRQLKSVPPELLDALAMDKRKGVVALAEQYRARARQQAKLAERWAEMTRFESSLRAQGKTVIVGIDEVGRGPLAGPVVAAAVALPKTFYLPGLNDSKKVAPAMREAFYDVILRDALATGIGIVSAERIDEINILEATREAMTIAVENLGITPDVCLIDAVHVPKLSCEQLPIIGGDAKSVSIAAASIVAKVTRDRLMAEYATRYPQYGFDKNAGYGTAEHLEALRRHGPSPIHRLSFAGVTDTAASR